METVPPGGLPQLPQLPEKWRKLVSECYYKSPEVEKTFFDLQTDVLVWWDHAREA